MHLRVRRLLTPAQIEPEPRGGVSGVRSCGLDVLVERAELGDQRRVLATFVGAEVIAHRVLPGGGLDARWVAACRGRHATAVARP
jgi:hypothetical protein